MPGWHPWSALGGKREGKAAGTVLLAVLGHGERARGCSPHICTAQTYSFCQPWARVSCLGDLLHHFRLQSRTETNILDRLGGGGGAESGQANSGFETEIPSMTTYMLNENTARHRQAKQASSQDSGSDMGEPWPSFSPAHGGPDCAEGPFYSILLLASCTWTAAAGCIKGVEEQKLSLVWGFGSEIPLMF